MLETTQIGLENDQLDELLNDSVGQDDVDYSHLDKKECSAVFEKVIKEGNLSEQVSKLKKLKPTVEELLEAEKNEALERFINNGGHPDDFDFRKDAFFEKFETVFHKLKNEYAQQQKDQQHKREANLRLKNDILAQMKHLIESGATGKSAFEKFKQLQSDFKSAGHVPIEHAQELWSRYQAVVNRFYDQRSIAFELVELDRKKNLQAKIHLCEKVEKLAAEPSIKKALKELEEIHDEFKHIGPVSRELQDEVWNRLKEASNKVYDRKKEYLAELKAQYEKNYAAKQELLTQLQELAHFTAQKPEEWAAQTQKIEKLQEAWKKAGLVEKEKVKEVNRQYWDLLKVYFNNKRAYFKELEKYKTDNLKAKVALCEKAEQLAQSIDWEKTTQEIISLQKEWKNIGHVPLKMKDKVYDRFKKACDSFFEAKRHLQKEQQQAAIQQVQARAEFVEKVEKSPADAYTTQDNIAQLLNEWNELPNVAGVEAVKVYQRFAEALKVKLKNVSDIDEVKKDKIVSRILASIYDLTPDGDKEKIANEKKLRKDIRDIEDNIAQMKNNMEFFARAKNAEAIRSDFTQKIKEEEAKLKLAKSRLAVLLGH